MKDTTIRAIGEGWYAIDSSTGSGSYQVNVTHHTCGCKDWTCRRADKPFGSGERICKHLGAVLQFLQAKEQQEAAEKAQRAEKFANYALIAGTLEDHELQPLLNKHTAAKRWDVVFALLCEDFDRRALETAAPVAAPVAPALVAVLANAKRWGQDRQAGLPTERELRAIFS